MRIALLRGQPSVPKIFTVLTCVVATRFHSNEKFVVADFTGLETGRKLQAGAARRPERFCWGPAAGRIIEEHTSGAASEHSPKASERCIGCVHDVIVGGKFDAGTDIGHQRGIAGGAFTMIDIGAVGDDDLSRNVGSERCP